MITWWLCTPSPTPCLEYACSCVGLFSCLLSVRLSLSFCFVLQHRGFVSVDDNSHCSFVYLPVPKPISPSLTIYPLLLSHPHLRSNPFFLLIAILHTVRLENYRNHQTILQKQYSSRLRLLQEPPYSITQSVPVQYSPVQSSPIQSSPLVSFNNGLIFPIPAPRKSPILSSLRHYIPYPDSLRVRGKQTWKMKRNSSQNAGGECVSQSWPCVVSMARGLRVVSELGDYGWRGGCG